MRRKGREKIARLIRAYKVNVKTQKQLDEHRRGGHAQYSPECLERKRGVARQRPHRRFLARQGGELSVDIGGPCQEITSY